MCHPIRFWNQVGFRAKADVVLGLAPKHLSRLTLSDISAPQSSFDLAVFKVTRLGRHNYSL